MLPIIKEFLEKYNPYLQPFYFFTAWVLLILLGINLVKTVTDIWQRSQKMHEIPCSNCQYFTNDHRLKCTVQPNLANTYEAVNCPDFIAQKKY
ncbi:MAG: hypothetical protein IGQ45_08680 [Cyanobacterium sp. T60_A2020_053]|nr:hypothetical protein [Cyanobacterium sp. T60_A2020_053]